MASSGWDGSSPRRRKCSRFCKVEFVAYLFVAGMAVVAVILVQKRNKK